MAGARVRVEILSLSLSLSLSLPPSPLLLSPRIFLKTKKMKKGGAAKNSESSQAFHDVS